MRDQNLPPCGGAHLHLVTISSLKKNGRQDKYSNTSLLGRDLGVLRQKTRAKKWRTKGKIVEATQR